MFVIATVAVALVRQHAGEAYVAAAGFVAAERGGWVERQATANIQSNDIREWCTICEATFVLKGTMHI